MGLLNLAPVAQASVITDNIYGVWGGANCHGGDGCVERVGDTAQVTWQVQLSALANSSNHVLTANGAAILIPDVVKDVKISLVAAPVSTGATSIIGVEDRWPAREVSPRELKIVEDPLAEGGTTVPGIDDSNPAAFENFDFANTPTVLLTHLEEDADRNWPANATGVRGGISRADSADWNEYALSMAATGIYTFEVTGTVKTTSSEMYIPIRATNKTWKCTGEERFGAGSSAEGCGSLMDYSWARTGTLPQVAFGGSDAEVQAVLAEYRHNNTDDGILGSPQCAPTRETGRIDTIGSDVVPSAAGYQKFQTTFNLSAAPSVRYVGSLLAAEDGCDQAAFHTTVCDPSEATPSVTPSAATDQAMASGTESSATEASESPAAGAPSGSVMPAAVQEASASSTASSSAAVGAADDNQSTPTQGGLPLTGAQVSGIGVAAVALLGAGVALLLYRRKQEA